MAQHTARLELRLPELMRAKVEAKAAVRGWTAAAYAREAIRLMLLDDEESARRRHPRSTVIRAEQ